MRYRVRHITAYEYAEPVDLASHMLHLSPRSLPTQLVVSALLTTSPEPQRVRTGRDHFGNHVAWMFHDAPHAAFEVTLEAVVQITPAPVPEADETPAWELVAAKAAAGGADGWAAAEFTFASPMAALDAATTRYAAESFPAGRPVMQGLVELTSRIRRDFKFRGGVTTIATPVSKVMAQRAGVCQDFSHLMIAGLRALGLPARYVSGYLRTRPPPGQPARRGADQSHAWVGAWLGPAHGWLDFDPTTDLIVQDEHVVLGWGRDYGDVSPVRGVILGGGDQTLSVGVDLEPVGE